MMRVLSPIYPADVLPVRDGWYLHRTRGSQMFAFRLFKQGEWRWSDGNPMGFCKLDSWQGLAFDPAGAYSQGGFIVGVVVPGAQCC